MAERVDDEEDFTVKKSTALKTDIHDADNSTSSDEDDNDEEMEMLTKRFQNLVRKRRNSKGKKPTKNPKKGDLTRIETTMKVRI